MSPFSIVIMNGNNSSLAETPTLPPSMHSELKEYSHRRGTEYPYNGDLDVDVLIVGAGFGGRSAFMQGITGLIVSRRGVLPQDAPGAGL